jgi:hypothetical protein
MTENAIRAVLRLRTLGPSGLNPPQIEVVDCLRALAEDGSIDDLDVDVWGASMGVARTADRDPGRVRETVTEYERWAADRGYTLRPAFDRRNPRSAGDGAGSHDRVVTPLLTLAVYVGGELRAVYPHVDDGDVRTVHEGVGTLESVTRDAGRSEDERHERRLLPASE